MLRDKVAGDLGAAWQGPAEGGRRSQKLGLHHCPLHLTVLRRPSTNIWEERKESSGPSRMETLRRRDQGQHWERAADGTETLEGASGILQT